MHGALHRVGFGSEAQLARGSDHAPRVAADRIDAMEDVQCSLHKRTPCAPCDDDGADSTPAFLRLHKFCNVIT